MTDQGCKIYIYNFKISKKFLLPQYHFLVDRDARALVLTFFGDSLRKTAGNIVQEFVITQLARYIGEECSHFLT